MATVWDKAPRIPDEDITLPSDPMESGWVVEGPTGDRYHHVASNGFQMLIAALAGNAHIAWSQGKFRGTVRGTVTTSDGNKETYIEPHGDDDIESMEDDVSEYLMDAEVPPPPRGREWYIRLPDKDGSFETFINEIINYWCAHHPDAAHPRDVREGIEDFIGSMYK